MDENIFLLHNGGEKKNTAIHYAVVNPESLKEYAFLQVLLLVFKFTPP